MWVQGGEVDETRKDIIIKGANQFWSFDKPVSVILRQFLFSDPLFLMD